MDKSVTAYLLTKLESELMFVRDISRRALEAHDETVNGLTKAQQGSVLLRRLREQRERLVVLGDCARDGLEALSTENDDGRSG
jgi:hypothetical protein